MCINNDRKKYHFAIDLYSVLRLTSGVAMLVRSLLLICLVACGQRVTEEIGAYKQEEFLPFDYTLLLRIAFHIAR